VWSRVEDGQLVFRWTESAAARQSPNGASGAPVFSDVTRVMIRLSSTKRMMLAIGTETPAHEKGHLAGGRRSPGIRQARAIFSPPIAAFPIGGE
jgi:hypothetical protein